MAEKLIGLIKRFNLGKKQIIIIAVGAFVLLMVLAVVTRAARSNAQTAEEDSSEQTEQLTKDDNAESDHRASQDDRKTVVAASESKKGSRRVLYIETIIDSDPKEQSGKADAKNKAGRTENAKDYESADTETEADIGNRVQSGIGQEDITNDTKPGYDIDVTDNPDMKEEASVYDIIFEQVSDQELIKGEESTPSSDVSRKQQPLAEVMKTED